MNHSDSRSQQKERLLRDLRSGDPATAVKAIAELGANHWLQDGSLRGASLNGANLQGVRLHIADLREVNLCGANLQGAWMARINLRDANLQGANLQGANLPYANLRGANLQEANLQEANLWAVILPNGTRRTPYTNMARFTDSDYAGTPHDTPQRGAILRLTGFSIDGEETHQVLGQVEVGKHPDCEICIHHRFVSRNHASLWMSPDGLMIRDHHTRAGTLINQTQQVRDEPVLLQVGDSITFADHTLYYEKLVEALPE